MSADWDEEIDFLVFGSGAGGMAAAVVAAVEGLSVLVCEKSELLGGTTATSGGAIWVPGSTHSKQTAQPSDIESARDYLDGEVGDYGDPSVRHAFLQTGAEALDYFDARTEVRFKANYPYPDYHPEAPGGATGGRALGTIEFDGKLLGEDFRLIRPPMREFMLFGGMMFQRSEIKFMIRPWASWKAFSLTAGNVLRFLWQRLRFGRGTRLTLGNALIGRLLYSLRKAGGRVQVNAKLVEIIRENDRVVGAVVEVDGQKKRIGAKVGIVVATGGFGSNPAWHEKVLPGVRIRQTLTFKGDVGEGIDAARRAGAALNENHRSPYFWMPASSVRWDRDRSTVFPHIRDRPKPGLIAVDKDGKRFVNEANSYHDFVSAMLDAGGASADGPAYLICDRPFVHDYGLGVIHPVWQRLSRFRRIGYISMAPSLEELARQLEIDPDALQASVRQHNDDCATGVDTAFAKGSTALNRFNGDPANAPNPCLRPIAEPPFIALPVYPTPIGSSLGLRTDENARVIGEDGKPVEGLYACGNDMSSIMGGFYPGPGITLGPAIVFAYRAARHAAKRNLNEVE